MQFPWKKAVKKKIEQMEEALSIRSDPGRAKRNRENPVDNLIRTILSQNTNGPLRDRAYASLKERFPTHDAIAAARPSEIAMAIRVAGLANQKSTAIRDALAGMRRQGGEISLDFLKDVPTQEAIDYLTGFRGIGDKTAAIVMLFSFGRKTFPVDTHIQRIAKRVGLVPHTYTPEKIRRAVEPHITEGMAQQLHVSLIQLGKSVCRPKEPACSSCPLRSLCKFASEGGESN